MIPLCSTCPARLPGRSAISLSRLRLPIICWRWMILQLLHDPLDVEEVEVTKRTKVLTCHAGRYSFWMI